MRLDDCLNIQDLRERARARLPGPIFQYLDGAAETEITAYRNTAAFDDVKLVPNCLTDVAETDTALTLLGQKIDWPVFCSPTGATRFYDPEGESAVARAAAAAGTFYSLSTTSTQSLETVAEAGDGPKMFQLYVFRDREITRELIRRCKRSNYKAVCLTVDAAVRGKRERELRSGMGVPMKLSLRSKIELALCPRWVVGQLLKGPLSLPNFAQWVGANDVVAQTRYIGEQLDPTITWNDVGEIVEFWGGPFAIKGVMSAEDARRAVDVGATAVIVSNHGGRQLDGAAAAIEALPKIVEAVGDRVEVILDGGVRRGVHVLKALALGAKACSIGRPYLYGLGAGGQAGVGKALEILKSEFVRAMQLTGCTSLADIGPDLLMK